MIKELSLLYPQNKKTDNFSFKNIEFVKDLRIGELLYYKNGVSSFSDRLYEYFTDDKDIIKYRLDITQDVLSNKKIHELFSKSLENIAIIQAIIGDKSYIKPEMIDQINKVSVIELYVEIIEEFHSVLSESDLYSQGLKELFTYIDEIYKSDDYINLKKNLPEMTESITNIKSITIGVNLYGDLSPIEAGIVSINKEKFKSGDLIDRLLRLDMKNSEYNCIASLTRTTTEFNANENMAFNSSINSAMKKILAKNLKSWSPAIKKFFFENTKFFTSLYYDIMFYMAEMTLISELESKGMNVCKPEISDDKSYSIIDAYCPTFMSSIEHKATTNSITFDEKGGIYILTGPNRGGKSVFLKTVGMCQVLFQLGMYLPCKEAKMCCVDNIFTHFPDNSGEKNTSRFENECIHMRSIFNDLGENSLVLLDEMFSSTNSYEAEILAKDILKAFCFKGARGIFATHIHSLCDLDSEINCLDNTKSKLDNLSVGVDGDGNRSYKIVRKKSDGKSYAKDIADKYNLSFGELI